MGLQSIFGLHSAPNGILPLSPLKSTPSKASGVKAALMRANVKQNSLKQVEMLDKRAY